MKLNVANLDLGGGSLLQVANRTRVQMMSYIIDCPDGGLIVIDGGFYCKEDAENLSAIIKARGGVVNYWFVTHCHYDHYGALLWLHENKSIDFTIENLCFNFPDIEWLSNKEDFEINKRFIGCCHLFAQRILTPFDNEVYSCGGVTVNVLNAPIKEEYEKYSAINSTSLILRVGFPKRDVLFLGDFDEWAEADLLARIDPEILKCDIVQMAHHGQNGVSYDFYRLIQPKICLYPTPKWLWENNLYGCNDPATVGKGPFNTLKTRRWMDELGVQTSYTLEHGDWLFK